MHRTFSKKSVVITTLVLYLLGEKFGNRLKTIDELATECHSSIGLTQAALKTLESSGVNRPGFPGECFICELRLPDHRFRWKHNKLFLL
ncbi:hypothetical protein MTQ63_24350, partial [Escherichia coli]|nr:hypothetical protein [Escherichia coli]